MDNTYMNLVLLYIFVIIIIVWVCSLNNNMEHMTPAEAVQNVAALYNSGTWTATNIKGTSVTNLGCDFALGTGCDRGSCGACRALVKGPGGSLMINFNNDFPNDTIVDSGLSVKGKLKASNRDVLDELTQLRTDLTNLTNQITAYKGIVESTYVPWGVDLSVSPINDAAKCFDFGSSGRTACTNRWSIVKLAKK